MSRTAARTALVILGVVAGCGGKTDGTGHGRDDGAGGAEHTGSGGRGNNGEGNAGGGPAQGGGPSSGGQLTGTCFAAGTLIGTPRGEVRIESLRVGDLVLAYDERQRSVIEATVRTTFVHFDQDVGHIVLGNGRELRVTSEHPVYLPSEERYVPAGELAGDERLLALIAGRTTASATSAGYAEGSLGTQTVFNIEVDRVHNYFAEGVLVHNKGTGGACNRPQITPAVLTSCTPAGPCIDPDAPSAEVVPLPASDAPPPPTSDGGASPPMDGGTDGALPLDAGSLPTDAPPPEGSQQATRARCDLEADPAFLAFDVWTERSDPQFSVFTTDEICNGVLMGEVHFDVGDTQPRGRWHSQCVLLTRDHVYPRITVEGEPGTLVRNVRFVSGCACARELMPSVDCGYGYFSRCTP